MSRPPAVPADDSRVRYPEPSLAHRDEKDCAGELPRIEDPLNRQQRAILRFGGQGITGQSCHENTEPAGCESVHARLGDVEVAAVPPRKN